MTGTAELAPAARPVIITFFDTRARMFKADCLNCDDWTTEAAAVGSVIVATDRHRRDHLQAEAERKITVTQYGEWKAATCICGTFYAQSPLPAALAHTVTAHLKQCKAAV